MSCLFHVWKAWTDLVEAFNPLAYIAMVGAGLVVLLMHYLLLLCSNKRE